MIVKLITYKDYSEYRSRKSNKIIDNFLKNIRNKLNYHNNSEYNLRISSERIKMFSTNMRYKIEIETDDQELIEKFNSLGGFYLEVRMATI